MTFASRRHSRARLLGPWTVDICKGLLLIAGVFAFMWGLDHLAQFCSDMGACA